MSVASVIIPAYNEQHRLQPTLERVSEYFRSRGEPYEIIVSDDGSTDGTGRIAARHAGNDPAVRLIRAPRNMGKGAAVRRAVSAVSGEVVLVTDADLSTPIEEYAVLAEWIDRGYDIVIGSRKMAGARVEVSQPLHRVLMGRAFSQLCRWLLQTRLVDFMCGFKCFTRRAAEEVFSRAVMNEWSFDPETLFIAARLGFHIKEVPVVWRHADGSRVRVARDAIVTAAGIAGIRANARRGVYGLADR